MAYIPIQKPTRLRPKQGRHFSLSLKSGKDQCPSSGKRSSLLLSIFVLFRSSVDWLRPTYTGEGDLLGSV